MPLDMVHEDIAYVSGYAHVRSDDRKDTLDAFGHLAVYIDMGTVGCRNIDQEPFPVTVRFLFLFPGPYRDGLSRRVAGRFCGGRGFRFRLSRTLDGNLPDNDILEDVLIHLHLFLCHGCFSLSLTISSSASSARPLPSSCLAGGGSRVQRKKARWEWVISFS